MNAVAELNHTSLLSINRRCQHILTMYLELMEPVLARLCRPN